MTCVRCNRPLTDPASIRAGIGPICASKRLADGKGGPDLFHDDEKSHLVRGEFSGDIVLSRDPDGRPMVNIAQTIELHSPTGFEWGYGGSGPADLALNILIRYTDVETAKLLHQAFKFDFIASLPQEGGTIAGSVVRDWLEQMRRR